MNQNALAGTRTGRTYTPRNMVLFDLPLVQIPGVIDKNAKDGKNTSYEDELRVGTPMGLITATKKWRPCPRTRVKTGTTGTVTALTVDNSRAFIVGDLITVGTDTGLEVTAINYSTDTLTIASTAVVDGEVVFGEDGSGICRALLNEFVKLLATDNNTRYDKSTSKLLIAGVVDDRQILGDLAAIRAATGMFLNHIIWADQQGWY